jgi:hypothetical protein
MPDEATPPEKKPIHPNMIPKKPDIPWDKILGTSNFPPSVLIYSYYFKRLGMPQKLQYGDWYFVNVGSDKHPDYQISLYSKKEADTFEDLNFLTGSGFVRILSPMECMSVILSCNYLPASDCPFYFDQENMIISFRIEAVAAGDAIGVTGETMHEVLISAAFKCYTITKQLSDFSQDAGNMMVNSDVINNDEDDE